MADLTPMLRQWMLLRLLGARRYGVTLREMADETAVPQKTIIHPYGFVFHRGSLYLIAIAPEHQEVRHYKIDRIGGVDVQNLLFPKPADFDLGEQLANSFGVHRGDGEGVRVRVNFLSPVARYVEEPRWHPSQQLKKQKDGSLLAEFELAETDEIVKWILSFGGMPRCWNRRSCGKSLLWNCVR